MINYHLSCKLKLLEMMNLIIQSLHLTFSLQLELGCLPSHLLDPADVEALCTRYD